MCGVRTLAINVRADNSFLYNFFFYKISVEKQRYRRFVGCYHSPVTMVGIGLLIFVPRLLPDRGYDDHNNNINNDNNTKENNNDNYNNNNDDDYDDADDRGNNIYENNNLIKKTTTMTTTTIATRRIKMIKHKFLS